MIEKRSFKGRALSFCMKKTDRSAGESSGPFLRKLGKNFNNIGGILNF